MFLYYIKETFNSLFRSKLGSLLIIVTTAIAIIFVTFSIGLVVFSSTINNKLKENIRISLFINDSVSNYSNIQNELKDNIYVESYRLISKREALKLMQEKTGKDFSAVLEANPLPASFEVKLHSDSVSTESIEPIVKTLESTNGIDDVVYDYTLTLRLLNYINSSKKIIYGVSIFLVLLSIYLVYSNNKLLLSSRVNQYDTMKLVGAKLRTIKIPIYFNGIIMGMISATICLSIYYFAINIASKFYNLSIFTFDVKYLIVLVIVLGIFFGFLGSFLATLNVSLKINKIKI
jgi:cell division transport system permease protein